MNKKIIFILAVVIVALVGVGIYYFKNQEPMPEPAPVADDKGATSAGINVNNTVIDCGAVGDKNAGEEGEIKKCFEQKFKECKPAKMVMSIDTDQLGESVAYYYEIIGANSNLCTVESKFFKNPNLDWIDKIMSCDFDSNQDLENQIQNPIGKCSGSLYDLMYPASISQNLNCHLQISFGSMVINGQKTEAIKTSHSMLVGVGTRVYVVGYQGQLDQVSWKSSNDTIAKIEPNQNGTVLIKSINPGKAIITANDNSVKPPCTSMINWESTQ